MLYKSAASTAQNHTGDYATAHDGRYLSLRSEGVCGLDGRSRAPTDGFMAYLGEQTQVTLIP